MSSRDYSKDNVPFVDLKRATDSTTYVPTTVPIELSDNSRNVKRDNVSYTSYTSDDSTDDDKKTRHGFGSKTEYFLSMVGYCVGLGNVWRFPYVCIRNGGGAFLIPFFVCLMVCGLPLYLTEVSLGQFVSLSPVHVFNICPIFKGVGYAMNSLCVICSWYYTIILAWALIYLVNSFTGTLPWTRCDQDWAQGFHCILPESANSHTPVNDSLVYNPANGTSTVIEGNSTLSALLVNQSSSELFWLRHVLQLSDGLHDMGGLPWQNVLGLLVATIIVYFCIFNGVQTVGKVVYVTALLPYLMLVAFVVKGATLPGAIDGVLFYLTPDFSKLLTLQTWLEACLQVFYSLGPGWGGLITMASYNKFNNNCVRDAIVLTFVCEGTSVFAGFAIFTILGHMSQNLNVPIANFSSSGPGLAFVVYPEAISYLPIPQMWGVMFFLMLFTLGLDSQFVTCEVMLTTVYDMFPNFFKPRKWKALFKIFYFIALFLLSLPFAARGGMYLFQLVDWYFAAFAVVAAGFFELFAVHWIYGSEYFLEDIKLMIGYRPNYLIAIMWRFITPSVLLIIGTATLLSYKAPIYQGYVFNDYQIAFGWCLAMLSFLPIPIYAVYLLLKTPGTFRERIRKCTIPTNVWQPSDVNIREQYRVTHRHRETFSLPLPCCSK